LLREAIMAWRIESTGVVFDDRGQPIGNFTDHGEVYDKNNITLDGTPSGISIGFIDIDGEGYDKGHNKIGFVDMDGKIYDAGHLEIASIGIEGKVTNIGGIIIGSIDPKIHKHIEIGKYRLMHFRAAAAVLLLINNP
jgi:hypothetical protein